MKRFTFALALAPFGVFSSPTWAVSPTGEFRPVPAEVSTIIGKVLPEQSAIGSAYLSTTYDPNLVVTEPATVRVTFVHEGAGYLNSLGWFRFQETGANVQIVERGLVFPNASYADPTKGWGGGSLETGDAVTLRDTSGTPKIFQPGDKVGFFLVSNGWTGSAVRGWNASAPMIPSASPATNATGYGVMTTIDGLNPEVAAGRPDVSRHVAMLRLNGLASGEPVYVMGFEDLKRNSGADNDFNDLVVLVDASPITAISQTKVIDYVANSNDPDGDGVQGLADYFPTDPKRAFVQVTPATGVQTLAFEDNYPAVGDMDYNDVVVQYSVEETSDNLGRIKDIVGTFHLIARGAGYDHSFGINIPIPAAASAATVSIERFGSDGTQPAVQRVADVNALMHNDVTGNWLRLVDLFPSTKTALPPQNSPYTNTSNPTSERAPASSRVKITFVAPVPRATLGLPPYDPFIYVKHGQKNFDVHLPGKNSFPDRPSELPSEAGSSSFFDDASYPFAILVPWDFRYPLEAVPINNAFPNFSIWRTSRGSEFPNWYASPYTGPGVARVSAPVTVQVRTRPWTIGSF